MIDFARATALYPVGRARRLGAALALTATLLLPAVGRAQTCLPTAQDDALLEVVLRGHADLVPFLDRAEELRLQVVVATFDTDASGAPCMRWHGFRENAEYTYPAGAMHLPMAMSVAQQMDEAGGVYTVNATLVSEGLVLEPGSDGTRTRVSQPFETTIDRELRRMAILSVNQAFNRLFDLVGFDELQQRAADAGYASVRFTHRFDETVPIADHAFAPAVRILTGDVPRVFFPPRTARLQPAPLPFEQALVGEAYIPAHDSDEPTPETVDGPMDFGDRNFASLHDLARMVLELGAPQFLDVHGYALSIPSRSLLAYLFSRAPEDLGIADIDVSEYDIERFKPLWPGVARVVDPTTLNWISHAGRAFGFHTDVAYVRNEATGQGFVVAATLYANEDGVLNDDRYEYAPVTEPFFEALGAALATWTLAPLPEPAPAPANPAGAPTPELSPEVIPVDPP